MLKLFVLLLCVFFIANCIPLPSSKKQPGRIRLSHKKLTYQRAKEIRQRYPANSKLFQEQGPIIDDGLTTLWNIGIPEPVYLVRMETGTRGSFVIGPSYPGNAEERYEPKKSQTSKKLTGTVEDYSGNNHLVGDKWQDNFDSGFANYTQNFGLLTSVDGGYINNPDLSFTALLGLSWLPEDLNTKPGPDAPHIINMLTFPTKEYAILFERGEENDKEEEDFWEMDFNGARICTKDNNFAILDRTDPKFAPMAFTVDGFKYDNYQKKGPFTGRLNTALSHIYVPSSIYSAIQKKIDIKYESDIGLSMVDCNAGDTLGNLVFTLNGQDYTIPPSEYIVNIDSPDGLCVLFIAQTTYDVDFIFGLTFLQNYCSYYSFAENFVGLGIPNNN
ncbi:Peptidase A1 domain-containing protein [Aphelenchoides bicaudatus]|nr:Peptidase A1 domain-containing protein [Aphelenchoides bicaudatus]